MIENARARRQLVAAYEHVAAWQHPLERVDPHRAVALREWERSRSHGTRTTSSTQVALEVQFENLADEWEEATAFESVVTRKAMHPAYQRIIGMGDDAVPLILRRLRREPRQWFWALTAMTGQDPAEGTETAESAAEAWLDWGRARGLVVD